MVDEPIGAIDRQVKAYDEAKKQDKRQQIERFFEGAVGDLEEVLPLSKIWNDRWLNATYPMKDIEKEIVERIRKTHSDIGIIVAMQLPCCDQMLSTYLETLDMSREMEEKHKYEQAQKAKAQAKQAEPAPSSPAEQPVAEAVVNTPQETAREAAPELRVLDFRVWVTPEQMQALKAFLLENNIRYGRVE